MKMAELHLVIETGLMKKKELRELENIIRKEKGLVELQHHETHFSDPVAEQEELRGNYLQKRRISLFFDAATPQEANEIYMTFPLFYGLDVTFAEFPKSYSSGAQK
jgi:hypothetical protein